MSTTSTRFGVTRPVTTDPAGGNPTTGLTVYLQSITDRLEALGARYEIGSLASRPSAAAANAGEHYLASDANVLFFSTGSAWLLVGASPLFYSTPGPYTPPTSFGAMIGTVIHIPAAGLWKIVMGADFKQNLGGGGSGALSGALDVQIVSGSTTFRAAGSGDSCFGTTPTASGSVTSATKQTSVTVTGSGANLSVWMQGVTGINIQNISIVVEPVSL